MAHVSSPQPPPITERPVEAVDIHVSLDPSAHTRFAPGVPDTGGLSVTKLLMFLLGSPEISHFRNAFLSEGVRLGRFLKELVEQYPASEDCISPAVHHITPKKVPAEMELIKTHTLFSSTGYHPAFNAQPDCRDPQASRAQVFPVRVQFLIALQRRTRQRTPRPVQPRTNIYWVRRSRRLEPGFYIVPASVDR